MNAPSGKAHRSLHDSVEVIEASGRQYSAVVDAKTADSSVVWVIDTSGCRSAFDHRADVELTVLPKNAPTV